MRWLLLLVMASVPLLAQTPPAVPATPAAPPREAMLRNLVQAGILMLEGGAYRQFVQTFLREEERGRFEKDFGKGSAVNYSEWGSQKAERLLQVLKGLSGKNPAMVGDRACFAAANAPGDYFSFVFENGGWYVENNGRKCQPAAPAKPTAPPDKVEPGRP